MKQTVETREEVCSSASKMVKVKLTRCQEGDCEGCVIAFECNSESTTCRPRCLYRMMMDDC